VTDPSIQSVPGLNADQIETRAHRGRIGVVGIKHADSRIQGIYSCQLIISTSDQQSSQTAIKYIAFDGKDSTHETLKHEPSFPIASNLSLTIQLNLKNFN
jgi:hypothetical protein